jgi:NAD(P)H-flavin reductase
MTFHIRNIGAGLSAHLSDDLKIGDLITLEGPYGAMDAQAAIARPVLMVAGGTGIAPMLSLAHEIIKKGLTEEGITLIYGLRSHADLYCRAELDALLATGEVSAHILTDPHTPDQELRRLGLNLSQHAIYVSGPDPMMVSVRTALEELLAHPARIGCDADMDKLQRPLE